MMKLKREDLVAARTEGLVRLASFLKLNIARGLNETEGQFRHRLINAIQRWEKQYARRPRAGPMVRDRL